MKNIQNLLAGKLLVTYYVFILTLTITQISNSQWALERQTDCEFYYVSVVDSPFNPSTKIRFSFPLLRGGRGVSVTLEIYDMLGREISSLINGQLRPGSYEVEWDATNFPSGVYFYKLSAAGLVITKKMVLLK